MGCCSSRPTEEERQDAAPEIRHSPQAITSQTAINHTIHGRQPRPLEPPSTISLQPSNTSQSGASTPHQSTTRSRTRPHDVGLADHYNLPLQAPKAWTSKDRTWTPAQLRRERYEFFETRVTGRKEIWNALCQVVECIRDGDIETAQGILDAVGVTLPTGRLEAGGYDEAGNLYRIPDAVLGDPTNIVSDLGDVDGQTVVGTTEVKGLESKTEDNGEDETILAQEEAEKPRVNKGKAAIEKDAVKIRCRLSDRGGPDVIVLLGRSQNIGVLSQRIRDEVEISNSTRIRVAYLGRILDEKRTLAEQGWKEGHVVNALISGFMSP